MTENVDLVLIELVEAIDNYFHALAYGHNNMKAPLERALDNANEYLDSREIPLGEGVMGVTLK